MLIQNFKGGKMKKAIQSLLGMMLAVLFLPSCHFIEKKEELSRQGTFERKIASASPSFSFRTIPSGEFLMGESQKPVEITRPFEMMATEVTQSQWFSVMRGNPSHFKKPGDCDNHKWVTNKKGHQVGMCPDHPVEDVSYNEVQEFIKKLNAMSGCSNRKILTRGRRVIERKGCYRLPTEAEWEYAVRAGSKTAYFFGDDPSSLGKYAIYDRNSGGRTYKVKGARLPNKWGLYDVYGNVWEWVEDAWRGELPGGRDPLVTSGSYRVLRGGSWSTNARHLRSAIRIGNPPSYGYLLIGFRLVRTL